MTGSVKEGYHLTVKVYSVSTYVLSYAACLGLCYGGISYGVEKRGFAVVNVTHNNYYGISRLKIFLCILGIVDNSLFNRYYDLFFDLCTELGSCYRRRIVVDNIIYGSHNAESHKLFNYLGSCHLKLKSEVAYGDFIGNGYLNVSLGALRRYSLQSLRLSLTLMASYTLLPSVLLRLLLELLLMDGVVAVVAVVYRSDVLITLVVLVKVN